jgi:hypothetical protein
VWRHTRALALGFSMGARPRWSASSRTSHMRAGALSSPPARSGRLRRFRSHRLRWAARLGPQRSCRWPVAGGLARGPEHALRTAGPRAPAHRLRSTRIGAAARAPSRRNPPPAPRRLTLLPAGPPGAHASSSRWPIDGVHWYLTIRWSRRGGKPPYRGQSYALAAPQLSSSVRRQPKHTLPGECVPRFL